MPRPSRHLDALALGVPSTADSAALAAQIEAALAGSNLKLRFQVPAFPVTLRGRWNVGMAVKEDSRDLGYAIGGALRKLKASGELAKINNPPPKA